MDDSMRDSMGGMGEDEEDMISPPSPSSELLIDIAAFEEFLENDDASVIGAFKSADDGTLADYQAVASDLQYDFRFAHSTNPAVLERVKAKNGGVFIYRAPNFVSEKYGDRPRERFPSARLTNPAVKNWLLAKTQPLVGGYTYSSKERYLSKKLPVVIVFVDVNWKGNPKGTAYYANRARKVAAGYGGKLQFAMAHLSDYEFQLGDFGLEVADKVPPFTRCLPTGITPHRPTC